VRTGLEKGPIRGQLLERGQPVAEDPLETVVMEHFSEVV